MPAKGIKVPCVCLSCGTPFAIDPSRIERGEGKFCSHACYILYRYGEPVARLWDNLDRSGECWTWNGVRDKRGYGTIGVAGHFLKTHRYAWMLTCGPIPDGTEVCHTCDNPACCRVDGAGWYEVKGVLYPRRGHLWLGTHQANMDDKMAKGRFRNGQRFTPEQLREVVDRYRAGDSIREIAVAFGMSGRYARTLIHGK